MSRTPAEPDSARLTLEGLFAAHHGAVARYVRRRTQPELVDDAVAETFLVACRRSDAVPDEPLPWLLGVARRVMATQRRSIRRRLALALRLGEAPQPPIETADAWGPGQDDVRIALAQLSELDREAITLIAWDGLTQAEAATALGLTDEAYRARLSRARRRLRQHLDGVAATTTADTEPSLPTTRKATS